MVFKTYTKAKVKASLRIFKIFSASLESYSCISLCFLKKEEEREEEKEEFDRNDKDRRPGTQHVFLGFEPYVTLLCLPRLSYSSAPRSPTKATDLLHPASINHFPGVQDAQVSTLADTRTQLEVC